MKEAEWLTSRDPQAMLLQLRDGASDRKLRLFACACVRQGWSLLNDQRSRRAVEVSELHADGRVDSDELDLACDEAETAIMVPRNAYLGSGRREHERLMFEATCAAHWSAVPDSWEAADQLLLWNFCADEDALRGRLLRDIFGNPFRPVVFDPAWRTSDVMLLAKGVYEERAFDRMPILADALQDAGCECADILGHMRDPNATHVRGCWALDLVLGKE